MPQHPLRGQAWFELVKQAIATQLGCLYITPSSILTQPYPFIEYDDEGNELSNGTRQEEVVEGVEALAGGSKTMSEELVKKLNFKVTPSGSLTTPSGGGPVSGQMQANSGWVGADLG